MIDSSRWGNDWYNRSVLLLLATFPKEIEQLKQEPGRDMLIYGSASIIQTLTNHGLIDEYQVLAEKESLRGKAKPPRL